MGATADQARELFLHAVPKEKLMGLFESTVGVDPWQARELLWNTYEPYSMWLIFTAIGVGSGFLILLYNVVTNRASKDPEHSFNTRGLRWVQIALVPIILALLSACVFKPSTPVYIQTVMFSLLLLFSFLSSPEPSPELPAARAKETSE
jgi:hypothetical protein